jgi:hypothetical protein
MPSLHPVDGSSSYSKSELVDVLVGLMEKFHPQTVDTQDWTRHFKRDHSDHFHAGLFTHAAGVRYSRPHTTRVYRGYSLIDDAPNLLAQQRASKERIFALYSGHDSAVCASCKPYTWFLRRQYPYIPGHLVGPGGKCLQVGAGIVEGTSRIGLRACRDVYEQKWSMVGSQLRSARSRCLSRDLPDQGSPAVLIVRECDGSSGQNWSFGRDGHLVSADGSCAMYAPLGATHGTELVGGDCGDAPEQGWRLYSR